MITRLLVISICLGLGACQAPQPPWCQAQGALEVACSAAHCVGVLVIDYKRLEPRGYRVFALEGSPVERAEAKDKAIAFVTEVKGAAPPDLADSDRAGDFISVFLTYDNKNEWRVVVHQPSGQIVFAEPSLWANAELRGFDFPLLEGYRGPEALGCVADTPEPSNIQLVTTGELLGKSAPSKARDAWEVARRLNFTRALAGSEYRVLVTDYSPAIGEFDVESADWYVFIYRKAQ